jgi:cytochrome b pre-mRNA-processing protein 3
MFLQRWLRPGQARSAGAQLYAATVAQAREPAIYAELGAPDTPDGRFEVYTLHVLLVLTRLQGEGARAAQVSQALFDAYLSGLDHGLRELAVGDLAVGKTMRKLGEAFYGRGQALSQALVKASTAPPDRSELEALLRRTVLGGDAGDVVRLADYVLHAKAGLDETSTQRLLEGDINWPAPV